MFLDLPAIVTSRSFKHVSIKLYPIIKGNYFNICCTESVDLPAGSVERCGGEYRCLNMNLENFLSWTTTLDIKTVKCKVWEQVDNPDIPWRKRWALIVDTRLPTINWTHRFEEFCFNGHFIPSKEVLGEMKQVWEEFYEHTCGQDARRAFKTSA